MFKLKRVRQKETNYPLTHEGIYHLFWRFYICFIWISIAVYIYHNICVRNDGFSISTFIGLINIWQEFFVIAMLCYFFIITFISVASHLFKRDKLSAQCINRLKYFNCFYPTSEIRDKLKCISLILIVFIVMQVLNSGAMDYLEKHFSVFYNFHKSIITIDKIQSKQQLTTFIMSLLLAPIVEETIRCMLILITYTLSKKIMKNFHKIKAESISIFLSIIVSSIIWSLGHWGRSYINMFTIFIIGVGMGYLYFKTKNILILILLHASVNWSDAINSYLNYYNTGIRSSYIILTSALIFFTLIVTTVWFFKETKYLNGRFCYLP